MLSRYRTISAARDFKSTKKALKIDAFIYQRSSEKKKIFKKNGIKKI